MVADRQLLAHQTAILELAKAHGARNVRVFGSVARGEQTPASDIDLLVDLEPDATLVDLGAFQQVSVPISQ